MTVRFDINLPSGAGIIVDLPTKLQHQDEYVAKSESNLMSISLQ
jgi:hypothetical protein